MRSAELRCASKESRITGKRIYARSLALKETQITGEVITNDGHSKRSTEIGESRAEVSSESEESNCYEAKENRWNGITNGSTDDHISQMTQQCENDKTHEENADKNDHESRHDNVVGLAQPPPAPAKLPVLPPLHLRDQEEERMKKLDATLRTMVARGGDTGTLQLLKGSLQVELQAHNKGRADEDENGQGSADNAEEVRTMTQTTKDMEAANLRKQKR
ncbi:hypothetical protein PsorP6_004162 [Peronosclerospora sorghi]|uniref:Uncharacterized protein n=1 Tax=Peronosclerospora sorghi TaxID=230839 RepID=A0ACC0VKB0_9STRA|nr:hypothetical protein PsorP6_004162 [Peronosclerospora sorghi]